MKRVSQTFVALLEASVVHPRDLECTGALTVLRPSGPSSSSPTTWWLLHRRVVLPAGPQPLAVIREGDSTKTSSLTLS